MSLRQLFGGVAEVHRRTAPIASEANDPNRTPASFGMPTIMVGLAPRFEGT